MSLFSQLRRLYRKDKFQLEDFHTEIVAQVLRHRRELTLEWLRGIGATTLKNPDWIKIGTQEEFAALADHPTDSRPDIAVRLKEGDTIELVLIESKVGAKEGPDQLKRYAEHLTSNKDVHQTALVFVTRDFEPDRSQFFSKLPVNFIFRQTRWFEFHRFLKAHVNGDGLAAELKLFMEENKMALHNQFRSIETLALENFLAAKALMDETLWSDVAHTFGMGLGKVSSQSKAMRQLAEHKRYVVFAGFGERWAFSCWLGYWLPSENPTDNVWVGVVIDSNPKSPIRKKVISAFRDFAKKSDGWQQSELDDDKAWGAISKGQSLQKFMAESDHIKAIKTYLITLLGEVEKFKKTHPELPWRLQDVDAEENAR